MELIVGVFWRNFISSAKNLVRAFVLMFYIPLNSLGCRFSPEVDERSVRAFSRLKRTVRVEAVIAPQKNKSSAKLCELLIELENRAGKLGTVRHVALFPRASGKSSSQGQLTFLRSAPHYSYRSFPPIASAADKRFLFESGAVLTGSGPPRPVQVSQLFLPSRESKNVTNSSVTYSTRPRGTFIESFRLPLFIHWNSFPPTPPALSQSSSAAGQCFAVPLRSAGR